LDRDRGRPGRYKRADGEWLLRISNGDIGGYVNPQKMKPIARLDLVNHAHLVGLAPAAIA